MSCSMFRTTGRQRLCIQFVYSNCLSETMSMLDIVNSGNIRLLMCLMICTSCLLLLCMNPGHNNSMLMKRNTCFVPGTVRLHNNYCHNSIRCSTKRRCTCNRLTVSGPRRMKPVLQNMTMSSMCCTICHQQLCIRFVNNSNRTVMKSTQDMSQSNIHCFLQ